MLYLTCTKITSVDVAHYGVSHAKYWVSVDCRSRFITEIVEIVRNKKSFVDTEIRRDAKFLLLVRRMA